MANEMQAEKRERTPVYTLARGVAAVLFSVLFPIKYHQPEIFQGLKGPYMVMANHQSWIDPVILAVPCKDYEIRFVGKKELTNNKLMAWLVKSLHMITVDRHNTDMQAMRMCTKVLREGKVLGIFPEGTRHLPDLMSEVETGTAVLALRSKVPLIPVYVHGRLRLFRRTHVYIGAPMETADLYEQGMDSQTVNSLCQRIRDTFHEMRRKAQ